LNLDAHHARLVGPLNQPTHALPRKAQAISHLGLRELALVVQGSYFGEQSGVVTHIESFMLIFDG
jgi:hypothetical protein